MTKPDAELPTNYGQAKAALARCIDFDEVATWQDKTAALLAYMRMADDASLQKMAKRIRDRAKRRHALLSKQMADGITTDPDQ